MVAAKQRCIACQAPISYPSPSSLVLCKYCEVVNPSSTSTTKPLGSSPQAHNLFIQLQLQQLDRAEKKARKLIKTHPDDAFLSFLLACILLEIKQPNEAHTILKAAGEAPAPDYLKADILAKHAESLISTEQFKDAHLVLANCRRMYPDHLYARYLEAQLYAAQNKSTAAISNLEQITSTDAQNAKSFLLVPRSELLLLLGELYQEKKLYKEAIKILQNLITQETAARPSVVAIAACVLGQCYLNNPKYEKLGISVVRFGAFLDPQNQHGLLGELRRASFESGGNGDEEIQTLEQQRKEALFEIQIAFDLLGEGPQQLQTKIEAKTPLSVLSNDVDKRVKMLTAASTRILKSPFEENTLYALKVVEDYSCWIAGWRLRKYIKDHKKAELHDEQQLKKEAVKQVQESRSTFLRHQQRVESQRQKTKQSKAMKNTLLAFATFIVLLAVFLFLAGSRFFDEFSGKLTKVQCQDQGNTPPCTLYIDAGIDGRKRYQQRQKANTWLQNWLDSRVLENGTIVFPLGYTLTSVSAVQFRPCLGKTITKTSFSFSPQCSPKKIPQ